MAAFAPASIAASAPTASIEADGNIVTGGLYFVPRDATVAVGDTVLWSNGDILAPHTATEDHRLWDLGGSYGQTPLNPAGFGPGATVQRVFEAGTQSYYCRVHPVQMHGTIAVPVRLALASKRTVLKRRVKTKSGRTRTVKRVRKTYFVDATWAVAAPATGQAFDVEVRRGTGAWKALLTGTTQTGTRISAGSARRTVTAVRARLRKADNANVATGWSPDAAVTRP
jgi:plastocyanin